jgi:hypothetical protein
MLALGVAAALVATPVFAQQNCKTGLGTCTIGAGGTPGGPCTCLLNRPVQGVIEGGTRDATIVMGNKFPQYCCTPAGRFPFANTSLTSGQACRAKAPNGLIAAGQACF